MKRHAASDAVATAFLSTEEREEEEEEDEVDMIYCAARGGGAGLKKRRLGAEQVRALERSFEVENKLEPERKARLSHELGLQPRQVAVWFQNRRARWKTKQLELDFTGLQSRYESLRQDFDSLRKVNNSLLAELATLRTRISPAANAARQPEEEKMEVMSIHLPQPPPADSDSSAGVLTDDGDGLEREIARQAQQLFEMEGSSFLCEDQEPCTTALFSDEHVPTLDWFCSDLAGNVAGASTDCWL